MDPSLTVILAVVAVAGGATHLLLAIVVAAAAARTGTRRRPDRRGLERLGPGGWFAVTLVFGFGGLFAWAATAADSPDPVEASR